MQKKPRSEIIGEEIGNFLESPDKKFFFRLYRSEIKKLRKKHPELTIQEGEKVGNFSGGNERIRCTITKNK